MHGQLEELYLYLPNTNFDNTNCPSLAIYDSWVESLTGSATAAQIFPNDFSSSCLWESAAATYGAGWYKITNLGAPWVYRGNSYRLSLQAPPETSFNVPYMWPLLVDGTSLKGITEEDIPDEFGYDSKLGYWALPIMKARVIQKQHTLVPTETYGDKVWEGVLEPYSPVYGVMLKDVRGLYNRLTIDYSRFGEDWNGITVPVSFQADGYLANDGYHGGGGIFSYIVSHPITSYSYNHTFLTTFMLLNVLGGALTSYSTITNRFDVIQGATRSLTAYDKLYYDKTGWFNLPVWDCSAIDKEGADPGDDGVAGADWYSGPSYKDVKGLIGEQDFCSELPLRMPTMEPWEWEVNYETGSLARCPVVELDAFSLNLAFSTDLRNYVLANGGTRVWVRTELHTFQGGWANSTMAVDVQTSNSAKLTYSDLGITLWDGKEYKDNTREYQEGIVGAPYLLVEIYDADPNRYYLETQDRSFEITGSGIQESPFATFHPLIYDQQARLEFRREHLLDTNLLGMNVLVDNDYLQEYMDKMRAFQQWVNETNEAAKKWTFEKVCRLIVGITTLIISAISAYYTGGWSAYMGIVFSIDQIQSLFTYRSIFSVVVGQMYVATAGGSWTEEQRQEARMRFDFWNPCAFDTRLSWVSSLWSLGICMIMIYGATLVKGIANGVKSLIGRITRPWFSLEDFKLYGHPTAPKMQASIKMFQRQAALGPDVKGVRAQAYAAQLAPSHPDLMQQAVLTVRENYLAEVGARAQAAGGHLTDVINAYNSKVAEVFLGSLGIKTSWITWVYRITFVVRQIFAGFLSPTEWVELAWGGTHGWNMLYLGQAQWKYLLWNWGDQFLYIPLQDETFYGFLKEVCFNAGSSTSSINLLRM